jgi:hypothetical protein
VEERGGAGGWGGLTIWNFDVGVARRANVDHEYMIELRSREAVWLVWAYYEDLWDVASAGICGSAVSAELLIGHAVPRRGLTGAESYKRDSSPAVGRRY